LYFVLAGVYRDKKVVGVFVRFSCAALKKRVSNYITELFHSWEWL
jgi:hypothetical protein